MVTGRRSWAFLLVVVVAAVLAMTLIGDSDSSGQGPDSLPGSSESARAAAAATHFPGGDTAAAVLVVTRRDGGELSPADLAAVHSAADRMRADSPSGTTVVVAPDHRAALAQAPIPAGLSGFALSDRVQSLRTAVTRDAPPQLRFQVTGGPAFGADIAKSFSGANTLLLAVTAIVVMALLALLPNTRSLGAFAAAGLLVAVVFVLFALPPALSLCGRKIFWPFIPRVDDRDEARSGLWYGIALRVVRHPVRVLGAVLAALVLCACGLLTAHVGLSQTEQFRVRAESVDGLYSLAAHMPSGASDPAIVLAHNESAGAVQAALDHTSGVSRASVTGHSGDTTRWSVVLQAPPASAQAFDTIERVRSELHAIPGAQALVGGSDAQALDTRDASDRDLGLIVPLILAVILVVLLALLRAIPAAFILIGVTVVGALAALGLGSLISRYVFGFPALDTNVPLFGFLFLVALGVDYTTFLVVRAREEADRHGTTAGTVRAVASTGAVITSAGVVLAAVFCVLGVLPLITLTQLGIVVGIGILLDTFVVRTVAVPAVFAILGDRIWWPSHRDTGQ